MTSPSPAPRPGPVPTASLADTLAVAARVLVPFAARGPIARRPRVTGMSGRMDADRHAVRRMQRLREQYGPGPVMLRLPGRTLAMIVAADHVHRVLDESPEPFATATLEKRAALSHFQPHGVLTSGADDRRHRRPFNEAVLDHDRALHRMADRFTDKVTREADALIAAATTAGRLTWDDFVTAWWRAARRVTLGDAARDDHALTDMLTQLRHDANLAYLKPKRTGLRQRFLRQLQGHLDRAEAGSLAELVADSPMERTMAQQEVPQWLFAFDAAAMACIRALALLVAHPDEARRVRGELRGGDLGAARDLPLLRAAVLESLRLWPTTPAILRDTTQETTWDSGTLPAGTGIVIFAPLFHRDDTTLPYANRFAPDVWLEDRTADDWPLVPFSDGPGMCPGRNLVLLTASTMLAALVSRLSLRLDPPDKLEPAAPLPGTLSPYGLRFSVLSGGSGE